MAAHSSIIQKPMSGSSLGGHDEEREGRIKATQNSMLSGMAQL